MILIVIFCLVELFVLNSIQLVIRVPFNGLYFVGDGDPSVPSDEINGIGYGVTVILIVKFFVSNPIHQLISVPSDGVNCVSFGDPSVPSDGVNCIGYSDLDVMVSFG